METRKNRLFAVAPILPACALMTFVLLASDEGQGDGGLAARIDALARGAVERSGVPGLSIAVARDGEIAFANGWGYADARKGVPAAADTIYPIGSLTRQFTAVAILQLAERKKLALDDPLTKWLPDFPTQGHAVTLRHLLTDTSGLPRYESLVAARRDPDGELDREQLFALLQRVPFEFTPGTRHSIHDWGHLLLSMVVAKASGEEYVDCVRAHILEPLELERTRFLPQIERPTGLARSCRELADMPDCEAPMAAALAETAPSLMSTAIDLCRWQAALDERLLIGEESTGQMCRAARLESGESTGHGLSMAVDETELGRVLSHTGGIGGFRVRLAHYVDPGLTVVVLANCESAAVEDLEQAIAREALGRLPAKTADLPLETDEMARLTGTWQMATQIVRTYEKEGRLWFEPSGQSAFALLYQGRRVFASADDPKWRITFEGERGEAAPAFKIVRDGVVSVGKRMGPSRAR